MKNLFLGLLLASLGFFLACEQENILPNETTQFSQGIDNDVLIDAEFADVIAEMGGDDHEGKKCMKGDSISTDSLLQPILDYVATEYPNETIVAAVEGHHHFSVELSNGTVLKFDEDGEFKKVCENGGNGGNGNGGGKHGKRCMKGDTISMDSLPQAVLDYIVTEYPDDTISVVVTKQDGYFVVELTGGANLVFDAEGIFIKECGVNGNGGGHQGGGHHDGGQVSVDDLPTTVTDYISENYPDTEVKKAYQKSNGNYFIKLDDGTKLVFDEDGNILYDSGE